MMRVFKWFGLIMLGALLVGGGLLIRAHLQVRSVSPALPRGADLLNVRSSAGPVEVYYVTTSQQDLERGLISHNSVVVEWADGGLFVIDVGMDPTGANDFGDLMETMSGATGPPTIHGTLAGLLGASVAKVKGVGFTHLHIDHTQGLTDFCVARGPGAVALQTSAQRSLHNLHTSEGAELVAGSCLEVVEMSGDGLVGDQRFPGIAAFPLGGHTPGSTLWVVAVAGRVLLFSGDITNSKLSIDRDIAKPWVYSYLIVPEDTDRTAEIRAWLRALDKEKAFSVVVSHDLASHASVLTDYARRSQ